MMNFQDADQINGIAQKILSLAKENGADEAAVQLDGSTEGLARFSRNQIIQNIEQNNVRATLAVAMGKHEASCTTNCLSDEGLKSLVKDAVDLAKIYPENPEHQFCIKPFDIPESACFDEETAHFSQHDKAAIVRDICRKVSEKDLIAYGTFTTGQSFTAIANTNGVFAHHPATKSQYTITVRTPTHDGSSREARSHHKLSAVDILDLTEQTMEKARLSVDPIEIEPGDYQVILSPTAALNYLMMFFWTLDARMAEEKRSSLVSHFSGKNLFEDRLFSPEISIYSRVNHPDHPMKPFGQTISMEGFAGQGLAASLFSTGLPVTAFPIVESGYLRNLFYSRFWAEKKAVKPVAFPSLIEFSGSDQTLDDLVRNTEKALLINSFWYIRFVDPNDLLLTGLTRDGAFLVENGEIVKPIKNLRFNESPLVSLGNIRKTGLPERRQAWYTTTLIPPMVIDNFTFSARTDAI
jgi:predicted Zn-dependent protease